MVLFAAFLTGSAMCKPAVCQYDCGGSADAGVQAQYNNSWKWLELLQGEINGEADYYMYVRTGTQDDEEKDKGSMRQAEVIASVNAMYSDMQKAGVEALVIGRCDEQQGESSFEKNIQRYRAIFPACYETSKGAGALPGFRYLPRRGLTIVDKEGRRIVEAGMQHLPHWAQLLEKWQKINAGKEEKSDSSPYSETKPGVPYGTEITYGDTDKELLARRQGQRAATSSTTHGEDDVVTKYTEVVSTHGDGSIPRIIRLLQDAAGNDRDKIKTGAKYILFLYYELAPAPGDQPTRPIDEQQLKELRRISQVALRNDVQLIYLTNNETNRKIGARQIVPVGLPVKRRRGENLHKSIDGSRLIIALDDHDELKAPQGIEDYLKMASGDLVHCALVSVEDCRIMAQGRSSVFDEHELLIEAEEALRAPATSSRKK